MPKTATDLTITRAMTTNGERRNLPCGLIRRVEKRITRAVLCALITRLATEWRGLHSRQPSRPEPGERSEALGDFSRESLELFQGGLLGRPPDLQSDYHRAFPCHNEMCVALFAEQEYLITY